MSINHLESNLILKKYYLSKKKQKTKNKKQKQRSNTNTDSDHNNTNEKKKKQRSKNFFMFFNLFFILQFVLPKSNPASKNSNPSQEHQGKEKNKLSSLTLSLMNSSSPIYSQQEQLSLSQDPNNMTTQNQEQLS